MCLPFSRNSRGQLAWKTMNKHRVAENGRERNKEQGNVGPCMLWKGLEFYSE